MYDGDGKRHNLGISTVPTYSENDDPCCVHVTNCESHMIDANVC